MAKQKKSRGEVLTSRTCKQISALIVDYVSNRLNPTVKREFEQHLSICPDCVSFVETYRTTIATTGSIRVATLPAKLRKNVLAFLRKKIHQIAVFVLVFADQIWR
jgi:anti-sigma factor RsiW